MSEPTIAPYGTWESPFTAELLSEATTPVGPVFVSGSDVYWLEGRPTEGGRYVLGRRREGEEPEVLTPEGFNVRTRVHEYGGGSAFVHGSTVFFSNFADQRLYRQDEGAGPVPVTPEPDRPGSERYADGRVTPDGRWIVSVRESHPPGDAAEDVVNDVVVIPADGSAAPRTLVSGADFYSFPRLDPAGTRLAWTSWNHPDMPWDATELWVAPLEEGDDGWPRLGKARKVAGGPKESVFQPEWSPEGVLHFVSDPTGWWNLYRLREDGGAFDRGAEPVFEDDLELGVPQWVFDSPTYAFLSSGRIAVIWGREGIQHLGMIDPDSDELLEIVTPFTWFSPTSLRSVEGERLAFVASGPRTPSQVCVLDPETGELEVLRSSLEKMEGELDPGCISEAKTYRFPSDGVTAYAFFYPPTNSRFAAPEGELPPLLVTSHGGPTASARPGLDLGIQFWTSRGFAVVDVNYGGSTGFGRVYRERLRDAWGIVDVADCTNAALHLAGKGFVDGDRLAIRGGSAGGYTTLCALVFRDDFAAGASYFGVADAEALARDTHKFESRYLDRLIGPYPEAKETYASRSPIHFAGRLSCPVILFQGLEDAIVPPAQAEEMVRALEANGLPYAYVPFEGEQHGFRRAENIRRSLEAELSFYGQIFGFTPAGDAEPVKIENLRPA
jgi:dipeptidyl aminopeptidase/acylaminoacyl peptidase